MSKMYGAEGKYVPAKQLKIGQEISGFRQGGRNTSFSAIVKEINCAYVTVLVWEKVEQKIDADCWFLVEMSWEEFKDKYRKEAKEVYKNIQNKLHYDEIGYHEMYNAWLYGDPYRMAKACKERDIKVIGHCTDITPKHSWAGELLDVGICCEMEDGERFWCHDSKKNLDEMIERYGEDFG